MTYIELLAHVLLLPLVLFLAAPIQAAAPAQEKSLPEASARIVDQAAPEKKKPANGREKLAVLDLDRSGDGIDVDLAYSMSVVLRDALHSYGQYEVLSKADLMVPCGRGLVTSAPTTAVWSPTAARWAPATWWPGCCLRSVTPIRSVCGCWTPRGKTG